MEDKYKVVVLVDAFNESEARDVICNGETNNMRIVEVKKYGN